MDQKVFLFVTNTTSMVQSGLTLLQLTLTTRKHFLHSSKPVLLVLIVALPVKLLQHLGLTEHSSKLKLAIADVLQAGETKTRDLGGYATTQQFTTAIINKL